MTPKAGSTKNTPRPMIPTACPVTDDAQAICKCLWLRASSQAGAGRQQRHHCLVELLPWLKLPSGTRVRRGTPILQSNGSFSPIALEPLVHGPRGHSKLAGDARCWSFVFDDTADDQRTTVRTRPCLRVQFHLECSPADPLRNEPDVLRLAHLQRSQTQGYSVYWQRQGCGGPLRAHSHEISINGAR
jgi:hypothetical protein